MQDLPKSQEERLLRAVNILLNLFLVDETQFAPAEGRMRYNPIDFQTLRFVEANAGAKASEIAAALRVVPTTLQSALDRLVKAGMMKRERHAEDGRARAYRLTEDGVDLRAAIHRQDVSNMSVLLEGMDADARGIVLEQLEKVVARLDKG